MFKNIWIKISAWTVLCLFALIFACNTVIIVGPGKRGIVMTWGKVGSVWSEGIHFKMPMMQSVVKMSVQIQRTDADASAASKDLQQTDSKIVLNYHIIPEKVNVVYQSIGLSYDDVVIRWPRRDYCL